MSAWLLSAAIAIPLGLAMGRSVRLERLVDPLVALFRPISPLAWIPLAILWFGIGEAGKVFIVFIGTFFPMLLATVAGVKGFDPVLVHAGQVLGCGDRLSLFRKVILPASLPSIVAGLRIAFGTGWAAITAAGVGVSRFELDPEFEAIKWIIDVLLWRAFAAHHGADYDQHAGEMSSRVRGLVKRGRNISDTEHERARTAASNLTQRLAALLPPGTIALNAAVDDIAPPFTDGTGAPIPQGLWTVAGLPGLATPCGRVGPMPVGVQLGASTGQEASLFTAARLTFEEDVEQG